MINGDVVVRPCWQSGDYLAYWKPPGIATTRGSQESLLDRVRDAHVPHSAILREQWSADDEYGCLSRLDVPTSGLVLFATRRESKESYLTKQQNGLVRKQYLVRVHGVVQGSFGWVRTPISHHPDHADRMITARDAQADRVAHHRWINRETYREVIDVDHETETSLLSVHIFRGARHQIRVHLASMGHYVVHDPLYLSRKKNKYHGRRDESLFPEQPQLHLWCVGYEIE